MIESTCVYLQKPTAWLFLLRNKKEQDLNAGYWIGVGGKRKPDESVRACAMREVWEETGLKMREPLYCGRLYFQMGDSICEKITLYTCSRFYGEMHPNPEGTSAWIAKKHILELRLWPGDRIFLRRLLQGRAVPFTLRLIYDAQGNLLNWMEMEPENE